MTASLTPDFPLSAPSGAPMAFSGRGREFLKLLITGCLYLIPTFGFYRFWLITKLRRHLWSNTQVAGEAFEYTGTAKELLVGFLIAVAVLMPIYIGYFLLGILLEEKAALASLPLLLIIYCLAHFGTYRARRYRATRTIFRGVRFWMTGSGWAYAARAIKWDILNLLTLGLALPWAMASLERYRMRHTYFGNIQGDFEGTGWSLLKRGWWVWVLGIAVAVGGLALAAYLGSVYPKHKDAMGVVFAGGLVLGIFGLFPLAMAIFTRWQMDGLRFGEVSVSSNLGLGAFYGLFFKLIFSSIGFLLAFAVVIGIGAAVFAVFFKDGFAAMQAGGLTGEAVVALIVAALGYLIFFLGLGVIQRYFLGRGMWAVIVSSISVSNLQAVDAAVAAGQPSGVLGEGLADALDFGVGV
ncbi:DUF898 family protein [Microvirga sp. 2TAF3]|uniref:DUF898 family protein n=1 Tax=Microvirga sp. 2TAF3 TaxID=3233014 RepID=UPI003F9D2C89